MSLRRPIRPIRRLADPDAAAGILERGHLRTIDVGQVGDRIFYEAGSVGMHAAATRELPLVDKGDYGALVRSIVAAIRYRPSEIRIDLDGDRTIVANAVGVAIANGPFMGPGVAVAPEALLDDGLFDVRVFVHETLAELLRSVASTVRGRRPQPRRVLAERASWVRISSDRPLAARADAVDLGSTPVVFEIRPKVLTVVAPEPATASNGSPRHGPHVHISGRGVDGPRLDGATPRLPGWPGQAARSLKKDLRHWTTDTISFSERFSRRTRGAHTSRWIWRSWRIASGLTW